MKRARIFLIGLLLAVPGLAADGVVDALSFGRANPAMRLTKHEGVQVVETAALSENWVCRGSGTSYNLFNWKAKGLRPNADYTLVVRARSFAGENAFNALVMLQRKDGKIVEGFCPAKGIVLGAGFREYRFPFTTTELEPESINFYKAHPTDADKGVDIAFVKILACKQVNLEVLPIFRGGRSVRRAGKMPVAGTEVRPPRDPYGKRAQGLNVLAIGYDARAIRNVQEAFAGLNVDLDVIAGPSSGDGREAGDDLDIFYSDSDAAKVLGRLDENAYGLYVILGPAHLADARSVGRFDEFYRSFRPDLRVWGFVGYGMKPEQIRFASWWFAAHRYGCMTWFSVWTWECQLFDMPTLALARDAELLRDALRTSRLGDGLGALMLAYPWTKRDIALYYSHESMLVSTALGTETRSYDVADGGPLHDYMFSRQGIACIVESLLHQHDFVAPDGRADFVFRTAFNDPAGAWTLRAEDVLTGLVAERTVTFE